MRSALDLWRGAPLADAADDTDRARLCPDLEELRLAAHEEWLETALELGEHRALVGPLVQLVAEYPLRERPVALLMLALYRSGRKSDALAAYADLTQRLREELGLDPDAAVQQLHMAILRDDLAPPAPFGPAGDENEPARPAQLPVRAGHFVGREEHLRELDALLDPAADPTVAPPAVVISAISGTAGVGKTALAVQWCHRVRDRFPDGQLFLNLRGYSTSPPLRPIEALAQFLRALGVPGPEVPADVDEAAAMFRTRLADRRVLVVLDNAHRAEQVRPLLPGSPRSLVVVTSRDGLAGLVAKEGARRLSLDVLPPDEAVALLASVIGADRISAEPAAAAGLARACAHLPLALRIAAARLLDEPGRSLESYLDLLTKGRLSELEVVGDDQAAVRAAFTLSYTKLDLDCQRMFRLFGLVPGPDITVDAAVALFGPAPAVEAAEEVTGHLDRLVTAHLLTEVRPGRYSCHDLLRRYADEEGEAHGDRRHAQRRLFDWYLHRGDAAAQILYPQMARLPVPERPAGLPEVGFADGTEAMEWLESERANLLAAVEHCAMHGPHRYGWGIADTLRGYFWMRRYAAEWHLLAENALAAARADASPGGEAAAELSLANLDWGAGRLREAVEHYQRALPLTRQAGWRLGEAAALNNIGSIYIDLGPMSEALTWLNAAVELDRELGWTEGLAVHLSNIGIVHAQLGQLEQALERFDEGNAIYHASGNRDGIAQNLNHLGLVHRDRGDLQLALDELLESVTIYREVGNRHGEVFGLSGVIDIYCLMGRAAEALAVAHEMHALVQEIGDRRGMAAALNCLGAAEFCAESYAASVRCHAESLAAAAEVGDLQGELDSAYGLTRSHARLGETPAALGYALPALDRAREAGFRINEGQLLNALAELHLAAGDAGTAAVRAEEAVAVHRDTGARFLLVAALLLLGRAATALGDHPRARRAWLDGYDLAELIPAPEAAQLRALAG